MPALMPTAHERRMLAQRSDDRAYWQRQGKANGVPSWLFCQREARGWSWPECADPGRYRRGHYTRTDYQVAREYGLCVNAISTWRRRHPEQAHLSADEIAAIILANKRRGRGGKRR